jgi:hypothetical protein
MQSYIEHNPGAIQSQIASHFFIVASPTGNPKGFPFTTASASHSIKTRCDTCRKDRKKVFQIQMTSFYRN